MKVRFYAKIIPITLFFSISLSPGISWAEGIDQETKNNQNNGAALLNSSNTTISNQTVSEVTLEETITDLTVMIKGNTYPNAQVTAEGQSGLLGTTVADQTGYFEIPISPQVSGTLLKINVNDGIHSISNEITVEKSKPLQTGWVLSGIKWFFYDQNGIMQTGWLDDGGKRYFLQNDGVMKTGWLADQGNWYFLNQSGVMQTGWLLYNGKWYFLDQNGVMQTGWQLYNGKRYYLDQNGMMQTGWVLDSDRWYYLDQYGVMQGGWQLYNGHWYYLDENGIMQTGWVLDRGRWFYLQQSGAMQTGWLLYNDHWYYLNQNGIMQTGWVLDGVNWYYLDQNGAMQTGWLSYNGKWYYLKINGVMATGWVQSGANWYFLNNSGYISSVLLDAPLIAQNPELPRGCEVTSLAMLLRYAGVNVDKMELAAKVGRDSTPYSKNSNGIYFGNPNTGFVGDMYSLSTPGYGVYHGPIAELAKSYLPNRIVDFSGSDFSEIYRYLDNGSPVWVINNVLFDSVPDAYWQYWNTPTGPIWITMKEHSVLVTGYDSQYIYFNDPLSVTKNRKASISSFKRGWEQMGRQAISIY